MIPQVDLFSFIFWKKLKTPKRHFEIIWLLWHMKFGPAQNVLAPVKGQGNEHKTWIREEIQIKFHEFFDSIVSDKHFRTFQATQLDNLNKHVDFRTDLMSLQVIACIRPKSLN